MSEEVILYDFCGTLVDFQTANAFVSFVIDKLGIRRSFTEYLRLSLHRLHLIPIINRFHTGMSVNKALYLYLLKGYKYCILNSLAREFYNCCIKKHFVTTVLRKLQKDVSDGKNVIIISGGYDIYLKYFVEEFNIQHLICSKLQFKNNRFTGKIIGKDCMGSEKVRKLYNNFPLLKYNLKKQMTLYSDSPSDIPLFMECDIRIAVVEGDEIPLWTKDIAAQILNIPKT